MWLVFNDELEPLDVYDEVSYMERSCITQSTNMLYTPYMVQKLSKLYNGL
jgi:hypothetical protein